MHREYSDAELQKALKETMSGCLSQTAARALYGVAEKTLDTYAQIIGVDVLGWFTLARSTALTSGSHWVQIDTSS